MEGTDKTAKRGVLSVLAVPPMGGVGEFQASTPPAAPTLAASAVAAAEPLAAVAWTDGDIARFISRRTRLLRWGWPEAEAEEVAERLVKRDRATDDDRVNCTECHHHRPGRCGNHRAAGLHSFELGRDLAGMLQRCPGFELTR